LPTATERFNQLHRRGQPFSLDVQQRRLGAERGLCCDSIFANHLDESIERLGVKVLNHRRSTIHSKIVGPPLQYRAPAHVVGSWHPRSATGNADQSPLKITPLLVRRGCRARQLRAGWATPRVFLGATDYFTEYLRMTTVRR